MTGTLPFAADAEAKKDAAEADGDVAADETDAAEVTEEGDAEEGDAEEGDAEEGDAEEGESLKKSRVIRCPYCDEAGFQGGWFLKRHVDRMHLVPIKCEICETVFVDKYWYLKHSKDCYCFCSVEGCNLMQV